MKRTAVSLLVLALFLSACIPALPTLQPPEEVPVVDVQGTDAALAGTLAVETLNALPTPTLEPATATLEPTGIFTDTATMTETATATPDPNPDVTLTLTTLTSTAVTGPDHTATFTSTATATGTPATVTATETLYARFYGTLPPAIPYGKVKLVNKSKTEVYISLQCTTIDGYRTILEYPVEGTMRESAPAGQYTYVAWMGGRKYQGQFGLGKAHEIEIVFGDGKITIK